MAARSTVDGASAAQQSGEEYLTNQARSSLQFSLLYFDGKGGAANEDKYRLLIDGARFADDHGFSAIWTPERHFHPFGGMYPNPSVTSAALATITKRVQLRAGSVVAPLHEAVRIAEEWAVVDNLSNGRIGISFASGWHADDFALHPSRYTNRKQLMVDAIRTVQGLWSGERILMENGAGRRVEVQIFPRPVQKKLPFWVTCSGSRDTFALAGSLGAGVLTHLLGQSIAELESKISLYREELAKSGYSGRGHVTLMMHTFLGQDTEAVRQEIRKPFSEYLASSLSLIQKQLQNNTTDPSASLLPWRRSPARTRGPASLKSGGMDKADTEELVNYAFDRYFDTAALFGDPAKCLPLLHCLRATGVDEVACLIDFGVQVDSALNALEYLDYAKQLFEESEKKSEIAEVKSFNEQL